MDLMDGWMGELWLLLVVALDGLVFADEDEGCELDLEAIKKTFQTYVM